MRYLELEGKERPGFQRPVKDIAERLGVHARTVQRYRARAREENKVGIEADGFSLPVVIPIADTLNDQEYAAVAYVCASYASDAAEAVMFAAMLGCPEGSFGRAKEHDWPGVTDEDKLRVSAAWQLGDLPVDELVNQI